MELRGDGENRGSTEGGQRKGIERVEDGVDGRQTKGDETMEDGGERRQARVSEKMEDGGVRQGGSRQEDWLGGAWKSIRRSRWSIATPPQYLACNRVFGRGVKYCCAQRAGSTQWFLWHF